MILDYYGMLVLKFIIGFVIVITHMNLSGKTQLSQMTPVDFIGNFVLGGIIGGVIYNDTVPMFQYVSVLIIGVLLISILNALSKHLYFVRSLTFGEPIPIIKNGKFLMDCIEKNKSKIDILNISSQLHQKGISSFQDVYYAQIEPNGQVTAIPKGDDIPAIIVMKDVNAIKSALEDAEKDEPWLEARMAMLKVKREDIFIAEFKDDDVTFILKNGDILR